MREVISSLKVWHAAGRREVTLAPGTILTECRIRQQRTLGAKDVEAYVVEFESEGNAGLSAFPVSTPHRPGGPSGSRSG